MATSTQDMVRPAECVDYYYYDAETNKKQCFATTQDTRYVSAFQNLTGGSQVFTLPPQNGVQDIVVEMAFAGLAGSSAALASLALPRGWGYALINQVSFRYGGSSTYFLTGDQLLQNALRKQPNGAAADSILTLGGNYASGADLSGNEQRASIVLALPHSWPSGVGKSHPFPSDILTQQIQITLELKPVASIWSVAAGGAGVPPTQLSLGQFQAQQVMLNNQGDALARRVDMAQAGYAFPAEFTQQVSRLALGQGAVPTSAKSLVATGFRSGEVKNLQCWLTRNSDQTSAVKNPFRWYKPKSIQMSYAGLIYARYENGSSSLWNLINSNKAPAVNNLAAADSGSQTITTSPELSEWVELPFAQTLVQEDAHAVLIHGKPITNGIVNIDVVPPFAADDWVLNVSYVYNTTILFSAGTCDYVF